MKHGRNSRGTYLVGFLIGLVPVIWAALISAPHVSNGIIEYIQAVSEAVKTPFSIQIVEDTTKCVLYFVLAYVLGYALLALRGRNYRRREEYGSARWGNLSRLRRKYAQKDNRIISKRFAIGHNSYKHKRNLNVLVVGGSGAGKTRGYVKPNVLQANCSMVVLDPKGEILRSTGHFLQNEGYDLKVVDFIDPTRSFGYNPFRYITSDDDIQRLATNIFLNTTPKGSRTSDPFWDSAAEMLLKALMFYLWHEAPEDEQSFPTLMEMLRAGDIREDNEDYQSPLDELFARLEMRDPNHIAVRYYKDYHVGAGKTLKSIRISLTARIEKFNLTSIQAMTQYDELDLDRLGDKKTALFLVIPDNDTSYNFLVGILYIQAFQQLYKRANEHGGMLPIHVHFCMDEFANVCLPDSFEQLLSTMRSRNISASVILQNIAQLKAIYKDSWESIIGNCDTFLYLGGNEQSTHEYVSKLLGKETIDTNTYGKSKGGHGSFSTNYQTTGRELAAPDEIRRLDNRECIIFIKEELPIIDEKFPLTKHRNIDQSSDSPRKKKRAKPYQHGEATLATATISFELYDALRHGEFVTNITVDPEAAAKYEIFDNEDAELLFLSTKEKENKNENTTT